MNAKTTSMDPLQIYRTVTENKIWDLGEKIQTIHLHRLSSLTTNTQKWERIQHEFNSFNCLSNVLVWHKPGVIPNCCGEEREKK